ncbi:putative spore germination protein [Brevibacillus brevis NBRC 100599]|uniref:Putative spore germination protein n=1 Tax=Brevibacillus brevis (strain 47 / JCM 6285 / NBRC 100599) TaxID=358681 RepID=C0ZIP7_BREBN|nr:Ger(x)C family spore germination protein [Brevibacillus brevis]BAH41265.1 putative spore germination protein [Brevibacillus brevis NBRC 100599]
MKQSHHRERLLLLTSLSVFLLFLLTGCWSSNDIDKMGMGIGLALDASNKSNVEKKLEKQGKSPPHVDTITMTYQFINPKATSKESSSAGPQQKAYLNASQTGESILPIIREFSLSHDTPLFSPHLKVIVISEALLHTHRLESLLDLFLRDNEIRPSCLLLVSNGNARDVLETKKPGELPALNLLGIVDNRNRTAKILPPVSLAKLTAKLNSESSFLLQNVAASNKEVKFEGAAVINGKTKKWAGFLNEMDLEGITWITGKGKGGLVRSLDKETGQLIIYEIETMESKITPHVDGNKISFDVHINSKGRLSENWVLNANPFENEFLKRVEKAAELEVRKLVKNVTAKMQNHFHADVAGFGERLRIEYPKTWEKVKKDWDQTFSTVPITYFVKLTTTDFGASGPSK